MKEMPKTYCAIIGDIVQSKQLAPAARAALQKELHDLLEAVNLQFASHIAANAVITLGDEFQLLLQTPAASIWVLEKLLYGIAPQELRFGIGIGEIYTEIDPTRALGADGPAYHNARKALDILKEQTAPQKSKGYALRACICTEQADSVLINALFESLFSLSAAWTERQRELIQMLQTQTPQNQTELAEKLHVKQPTVSRLLDASGYLSFRINMQKISSYLDQIYGNSALYGSEYTAEIWEKNE